MNETEIAERFIKFFAVAARQAGAVALRLQGKVRSRHKPGKSAESEALSVADLAAQDVILHLLASAFPEAEVDAEEETDTVALFSAAGPGSPILVIDPIDGSLNYIRRKGEYAVMGACLLHDAYQASLIYFPLEKTAYWAVRGGGCWFQKGAESPRKASLQHGSNQVLITPPTSDAWKQLLAGGGFEPVLSRCSASDATAPVSGRAPASVSPDFSDRRRAIGYLLTVEAGGIVQLGDRLWQGEDPESLLNKTGPCIVAPSEELRARICLALQTTQLVQ